MRYKTSQLVFAFSVISFVVPFRRIFNLRTLSSYHNRKMSETDAITLNREAFKTDVRLIALKIPAKSCMEYLNTFKDNLYMRPKMKKIYEAPDDPQKRLLLLSEKFQDLNLSDLPIELKKINTKYNGEAQEYILQLGYEHYAVDEILKRLLPNLAEVPSAFEQAGHLAHLNLRDEALPYKKLIAQVLLDKNPAIKTVVNKIGNIETEFRTFPMEVRKWYSYFDIDLLYY